MINTANLKKRLIFVVFAVPLALIIINSQFSLSAPLVKLLGHTPGPDLAPIYPGQVLAFLLAMLGVYEYRNMLSIAFPVNAFWIGYVWIFTMGTAYLFNYPIPGTLSIYVLLMFVAFEAFFCGRVNPQARWKRACLFFSGIVFLNIASISMMSLYRDPFQQLFSPSTVPLMHQFAIVIVITSVFMCDSVAYFVGSAWGKRRLSASISPNKTIEGSAAGLLAPVVIISVCWIFIRNPQYPIIIGPVMGILIGITAQVGDLLVSLIKRYFKVKDAGNMIHGHGGILDRFDSVFFTAPVLYLLAWVLTR
ncbi:MAG: phosphatidate cytidylyltransferase [Chitinispirillales bacterium]|jgi:phosphatidate cytidylyltransferase|nr:phosphatidate cytidylyltransferase [Chitinispirillales bacterium]